MSTVDKQHSSVHCYMQSQKIQIKASSWILFKPNKILLHYNHIRTFQIHLFTNSRPVTKTADRTYTRTSQDEWEWMT